MAELDEGCKCVAGEDLGIDPQFLAGPTSDDKTERAIEGACLVGEAGMDDFGSLYQTVATN